MNTALNTNTASINFTPEKPFHKGWAKISGIEIVDSSLVITPSKYFERFEDPVWNYVPWDVVQAHWMTLSESRDFALEQVCLSFVRQHAIQTDDPVVVLKNAERVYSHLYNESLLREVEDLDHVNAQDLRILRESSILCALNKVGIDGRITNIGPAWYFAQCARLVYALSAEDEQRVDELFHGGFFNGVRLREQTRAHAALGGKLVHGCQGSGHGAGGCVVAYGTDIVKMQEELLKLRPGFLRQFGDARL